MTMDPEDFGKSFKGFMDQMSASVDKENTLFDRLTAHFGEEPSRYQAITEKFEKYDHPNLQLALDRFLEEPGTTHELIGVTTGSEYLTCSLANIATPAASAGLYGGGASGREGPVEFSNIRVEDDSIRACVTNGLFLIRDHGERLAVLIQLSNDGLSKRPVLEAMASQKTTAERFFSRIRTLLRQRNIYRGHVISVSQESMRGTSINFHRLPKVSRESIILPSGLLEKIERQTIKFGQRSDRLLAAGRHLKTGLLLHGPPGTGKTLTAMYIASEIRNRTVILMTGRGLGLLEQSCRMARILEPAIVILEDVDLIAEERGMATEKGCSNVLLFELLNEMDGLADDCDVMFLLTTNRPDVLEPALAARPGRIDQAYHIPLPDAECRERLFDLYRQGLQVDVKNWSTFVKRTEGASAAFIRELLRKAALFASDDDRDLVVKDAHLDEAMHEMCVVGGELSASLLGFKKKAVKRKGTEK
ncbi:MAG: AAA family ATPase [Candidatus Melainabacteria bacterium]|nr:AAA family ATPase [Candidatus Melainabacteria bacterium]